jgi:hypothetical protein
MRRALAAVACCPATGSAWCGRELCFLMSDEFGGWGGEALNVENGVPPARNLQGRSQHAPSTRACGARRGAGWKTNPSQ